MRLLRSSLLLAIPLATYACSSDDSAENDSNGSGGSAPASGGQASGDGGTGADGSGGSSSGGQPSGDGGAGTGGLSDGTGGDGMGGDGMGGAPGTGGAAPETTLDDCFMDLPEPVGSFQDATKESSDGTYRVRLALDTGDNFGTSGTSPWQPVRLGIETPTGVLCLTDAASLAQGHTVTHHNCDDTLVVTVGSTRYEIENPDTAADYVDPETWRRPSLLQIYEDDVAVGDPIRLDTVSCNESNSGDGLCRSGGPC